MARYIDEEAILVDKLPNAYDVAPSWVPADQNPPEGYRYLTVRMDHVTRTAFIDLLWFDNGEWWDRQYRGNWDVLWWIPLPAIPKMDGGEEE